MEILSATRFHNITLDRKVTTAVRLNEGPDYVLTSALFLHLLGWIIVNLMNNELNKNKNKSENLECR